METNSRNETLYRLGRAIRTRHLDFDGMDRNPESYYIGFPEGHFRITLMPGNRRILISSDVKIEFEHRGKGLGRKMLNLREEIAKEIGCNLILATVRNDNAVEAHLLATSGWKILTRREIASLWGKELNGE